MPKKNGEENHNKNGKESIWNPRNKILKKQKIKKTLQKKKKKTPRSTFIFLKRRWNGVLSSLKN